MITILTIVILIFISLITFILIKRKNYTDEYNKRYIEKIKQNVAKSLVNPYRKK
jgi:preprotein translocase subunit SecG